MKAISILIASIFLFSLGVGVLAQETELPEPGLTPDSPFYFLETIAEGIGTFFTFGDLKKAERYAALAAERLAEVQAVVEKGKPELTEKTLQRYENQLNNSMARAEKAQAKGQSTEKVMEVVAKAGKATSIHLEILAEVYEKVPEEAKPAIEKAMGVSVKGHEKAVEVLKAKDALGEVPERVSLPVEVPEEVKERIRRDIVVGGPCSYDKFKGECKITSIVNESTIRFKFIPTELINIEWAKKSITREGEVYARYLGWKCLEKHPITKEDLEKCGIKENATLDCEMEVITFGTCTPIIFKFHEPTIIGLEGEKLDCPYECCIDEQYKTKACPVDYECQENKCVEIVEERKECFKEGETFDVMMHPDAVCCSGLTTRYWAVLSRPVGGEISCIAPVTPIEICVKCGDKICGEGENWCICPEDCPKPEKISCTTNSNCGTDSCQQGRDKCVEIKYVCEDGKCFSTAQEFPGFMCQKSGCEDTCYNGICEGEYEKLHCSQDCPEEPE